jgi:uncharacterized protein
VLSYGTVEDNPFEYSKPLPAGRMVDRRLELSTLGDQLANTHNSRLVGPRRYGKTTLINAALAQARDDGLVAIQVNFLGVLTLDDIAERIERAYSEQLDSSLKQWFSGILRTLQPTLTGGGGPVPASVAISPRPATSGLLDRLALPAKVHAKHGLRCAIAFDEFQDVLRAGPNADGIIRSEIEGHAGVAGYVFSGSHIGMMRELFAARRRAFFGQATPINLGPLAADELGEYISAGFRHDDRDPGEALGPLLDLAQGHPQRALMLANKLFTVTDRGSPADSDAWARALTAACDEAEPEITQVWNDLPATARRALAVIAHGTIALNGRTARERYGLPKTGSTQQAVQHLADEGHIVKADTRTGWAVVDPLLGLWLRGGRRWPDLGKGG